MSNSLSDELSSVSPRKVSCAVMEIANKLQDYPSAVQLAAVGYAFGAYIRATGRNASDVLALADRIKRAEDGIKPEFRALDSYLKSLTE